MPTDLLSLLRSLCVSALARQTPRSKRLVEIVRSALLSKTWGGQRASLEGGQDVQDDLDTIRSEALEHLHGQVEHCDLRRHRWNWRYAAKDNL